MSLSPLFQQKTTKNYQNFLPKDSEVSNFVGVIRLFALVYSSADDNAKTIQKSKKISNRTRQRLHYFE